MKPNKIYLKELIRKMVYYAVARGNKTGIFQNWVFCKDAIDGFPDACFKKFEIQEEAQKFIDENSIKKRTQDLKTYYFDAGQFYFSSKRVWLSKIRPKLLGLPIPNWRVVDIDTIEPSEPAGV